MTNSRCVGALLVGAMVLLIGAAHAAPTTSIDLGGVWQTIGLDAPGFPSPDAGQWREADVIAPVRAGAWVCQRRSFDIPPELAGQRLFLRFEGVKYTAQVRCNGAEVGRHIGGYEPFECDITRVARVGGENVVEVLAGSWHQLTADPEAVAAGGFGRDAIESAHDQILYPIGSHSTIGIWAPVSLQARPDTYIEDIYIIPSFRNKTLTVQTTVRNLSAEAVSCSVAGRVMREGTQLLRVDALAGEVAAGTSQTLSQEVAWEDPPLWWPQDPVLLHLRCDLDIDGELIDRKTERFGFRELWADGSMFVLNGIPMHMLGSSCHPLGYTREVAEETYRLCREGNINSFRLHAQPWGKAWYDVADETGMLITHETAVWCHVRSYALGDDRFWANFAEHIRAQIKLHRNRPSVFAWSLENEILHCGGTRVEGTEQRLADLAAVAREMDASRLLSYDGDGDPKGAADIINLHYPHRFPRNRLWPTCCWWLDETKLVEGWPHTEWLWSRDKPLYIGEYLWQPSNTPGPASLFFGDEAYLDATRSRIASKAAAWRYQVEAYRAQGMSGGCPWNIFEGGKLPESPMYQASKLAYRPQCAIIKEWDSAFHSGRSITRTVTFINDVLRPATLKAAWFCHAGGEESSRGEMTLEMQPAEIRHETVRLQAPEVDARTPFEIVFKLEENGEEIFRETRPCWAAPPDPAPNVAASRLALYDPSGKTRRLLTQMGIEAGIVAGVGAIPDTSACLVIGEDAFEPPAEDARSLIGARDDDWSSVRAFLQRGGHVIVLAQRRLPEWLPASLMTDGSTFAFARRPDHPLVAGCEPGDFSLWGSDHIVSHLDLARPSRGNVRMIVDAGGEGSNRGLLMETPMWRGSIVLCQLDLIGKSEGHPVARRTLSRLLEYGLRGPAIAPGPMAVLSRDSGIMAGLKQLGVRLITDPSRLQDAAVLLVDGDNPQLAPRREQLARWVEGGGVVWLHAPSEEYLGDLGLSRPGVLWEVGARAPVRALPTPGLGAGLRTEDLYWLSATRPQRYVNWSLTPDIVNHILRVRAAPGETTMIPVEELDNSTVKITRRTREGIWLHTAGTVTTPITIPRAGQYVIGVLAGGNPMGGAFPAYLVAVDDTWVGGFTANSTEPALHSVSGELPAGRHELRISFVNDASNPPNEDRNGLIAGAQFGPASPMPDDVTALTEPTALYTIRRGEGAYLIDGINWQAPGMNANKAARLVRTLLTNAGVEMRSILRGTPVSLAGFELDPDAVHVRKEKDGGVYLGDTAWVEGTVEFAEAGRYDIILEARGTAADGEFPEIELSIDGQVVGAKHLLAAGWQDVVLTADIAQGERMVRIRFTNDLYDEAQHLDRNLWIKRMAIAPAQ